MKTVPCRTLARLAAVLLPLLAAAAAMATPALSAEERAAVYAAAGLRAVDGGWRHGDCTTPLKADAEALDLDGDGRAEVLLYLTPSRCFPQGEAGTVALFMRDRADPAGRWVERLGFVPGVEVVRQEARHAGLPDLGVANPGGCMPIYRWDGEHYRVAAQKALQPGGCQFRE
jgi:hypothetical protein